MASEDAVPLGTRQAHSLLELPSPWLQQLVEAFGSKSDEDESPSLLALFRSCRFMRDLVLSLHHVRLEIRVPLPLHQLAATHSKLLLACKHPASRVKLHMEQQEDEPGEHTVPVHAVLGGAMAAAGHGLNAITHVKLTGLTLGALVPPWLIVTCPHMTALHLEDCTFNGLPSPDVAIPTCSSLTELHVDKHATFDSPAMMPLWHHQLRSLPNLTSLSADIDADDPELQQLQHFSATGTQITSLELTFEESCQLGDLAVLFPSLCELRVNGILIDDADMEVLLSLKRLRVLGCSGFVLEESYTNRPCSWTHLRFRELDIASFDRLPLGSVQSLASDDLTICTILPCDDLAVTNRVAATVSRLGWKVGGTWAILANRKGVVDSQCLAAALAMIPTCNPKVSGFECKGLLTPDVLATITQCLACLPVTKVTFNDCTWAPGVWPLLLPSLPPTVTKVTLFDDTITEAELTVMCVYACRPVEVYFELGTVSPDAWYDVWQPLVQRAMAAAGHQHVDINIYG